MRRWRRRRDDGSPSPAIDPLNLDVDFSRAQVLHGRRRWRSPRDPREETEVKEREEPRTGEQERQIASEDAWMQRRY